MGAEHSKDGDGSGGMAFHKKLAKDRRHMLVHRCSTQQEIDANNYVVDRVVNRFVTDLDKLDKPALEKLLGDHITENIAIKCVAEEHASAPSNSSIAASSDPKKFPRIKVNNFADIISRLFSGCDKQVVELFAADAYGTLSRENVEELVQHCARVNEIQLMSEPDLQFLDRLVLSIMQGGDSIDVSDVLSWTATNCCRFLSPLKAHIVAALKDGQDIRVPVTLPTTNALLTQGELWFLAMALPSIYVTDGNTLAWTCLYDSSNDGMSTIRFTNKVCGYNGPTIMFCQFTDGLVFCVALDEQWRESSKRWGGVNCAALQLRPVLAMQDNGSEMFYFQIKSRTALRGMQVGHHGAKPIMVANPDFSNICGLEVWANGSPESFLKLAQQKNWEKRQVDKAKHVPLPGKWEENPDRLILELAGITTDHPKDRVGN